MTEIPNTHFTGQISVKAIIEKSGAVLICRSAVLPEYWEFPGGRIHTNESASDALVREVKEELGLDIIPGSFIHSEHYIRILDYLPTLMLVFEAESLSPEQTPILDSSEIAEIQWITRETYTNYNLFVNCKNALEKHFARA
jgi:8-oxo-dGTP pyrophosphatase MutT (NUDIX family)